MKNKLIIRMYIILFITVILVVAGVLFVVYVLTFNTMMDDIHLRAVGVKDYILESLYADDLLDIGLDTPEGRAASRHIQEIHDRLKGVGNLSRLYLAREDEHGRILTSLNVLPGADYGYTPSGELADDLMLSLRTNTAVLGSGIYRNDSGDVYTIFWPVMNQANEMLGAVSMEFDVNLINRAHRQTTIFSFALSGGLLAVISIIAFVSMSRVSEPFYKKLAYTDLLSGYENRMAFEHKLRECGDMAEEGKNVTLVIFDVNNLKTINDSEGHEAGDKYLKNTADMIYENLKGRGPLYRIGGDEYAVIFADRSEREIEDVLDSLRNEKRMAYKKQPFSCAFGAATFDKSIDNSLRDVFKRADEAMYEHKKQMKAAGVAMRA